MAYRSYFGTWELDCLNTWETAHDSLHLDNSVPSGDQSQRLLADGLTVLINLFLYILLMRSQQVH
jgi:hypothetical protein